MASAAAGLMSSARSAMAAVHFPAFRPPASHFCSLLSGSVRASAFSCFCFFSLLEEGSRGREGVKAGCVTVGEVGASDLDRLLPPRISWAYVCHARVALPRFVNKLRDNRKRGGGSSVVSPSYGVKRDYNLTWGIVTLLLRKRKKSYFLYASVFRFLELIAASSGSGGASSV